MRKVISNTSPILSLLRIDNLHILKDLYTKIIIPKAVYLEIEEGKEKNYYQDLTEIDWIEIKEIENTASKDYFPNLNDGEVEVLAKELNADCVIMYELMGRRNAKQLGMNLTGTIGILLKAKEKGLIVSVKDRLSELSEKGIWLSPKLVKKAIRLANED